MNLQNLDDVLLKETSRVFQFFSIFDLGLCSLDSYIMEMEL